MLIPVLLSLQAQAPVQPPPAVAPPRIEAEVVVDGRLDEPAWAQALRLGDFRQYRPVDGRPAEERTEVLVWYAPDAIHFGIVAHDSRPGTIRATNADRDRLGDNDRVRIYLDTFLDRRRAFFFGVDARGAQEDGVWSEGASGAGSLFGGTDDTNPDYVWDSQGMVTDSGYVVEVRIPFKSLRLPGKEPQAWGFNVERVVQRNATVDTWTDTRRASASFLAQAGQLEVLTGLRRGVVFEAQPFATATSVGSCDASGEFVRDGFDPEVGINVRVGFPSLALDGTINPDFSTVETDAGQVTVNVTPISMLPTPGSGRGTPRITEATVASSSSAGSDTSRRRLSRSGNSSARVREGSIDRSGYISEPASEARSEPQARTMSTFGILTGFLSIFGWVLLGFAALLFAAPFAFGAWAFGGF